MAGFAAVLSRAEKRKGRRELAELLPGPPSTAAKLRRLKDSKALSTIGKGVFRAGFNWTVVENKWPAMERALAGFEPEHVASLDSDDVEELIAEGQIIRNRMRLQALIENARWMLDIRDEYGSFGRYVAAWPSSEIIALWREMKEGGSRLGASTGPYLLRELGKDSFLPTKSVMTALVRQKVIERPTTSQGNLAAAQATFNEWHEETGRPYCELSRIAACSVDA